MTSRAVYTTVESKDFEFGQLHRALIKAIFNAA